MNKAFLEAIEKHGLITPGDRGAVAFSGGGDSLCLLHLMLCVSEAWSLNIQAVHVDHGLRPESAKEASRASKLAFELGVELTVLEGRVGQLSRGNVQQAARDRRLSLLGQHAREHALDWIALGHTASDQAETVLMRAVRGAGVRGLRGMAWRRGVFIRPLLEVTRAEVEQYIKKEGLDPILDPTNATDAYFRNRIRNRIIPLLSAENPSVIQALCRLAANCREEDSALEELAEKVALEKPLSVRQLARLPRGMLQRVMRMAYQNATASAASLERRHLVAIERLLCSTEGSKGIDLPSIRLQRRYDELHWMQQKPHYSLEPAEITEPGRISLSSGGSLYVGPMSDTQGSVVGRELALNAGKVSFPLRLRAIKPGDRIVVGRGQTKKVARVLIDEKWPRHLRPGVPVLLMGEDPEIIAIAGVRCAHEFGAVAEQASLYLRLEQ